MQLQGINLQAIPAQRRMRKDTDLEQFLLADRKAFEASAHIWVRQTAEAALQEALRAGNPKDYVVGIDGETRGGTVRTGFRSGPISSAQRSVRIEFIGSALADIANGLMPILIQVLGQTFQSRRSQPLRSQWSWWIQKDRYAGGSKSTRSTKLGTTVPDTVSIYDVLWLAPDDLPAEDAHYFLRGGLGSGGHAYNLIKKKGGDFKLRKRLRGFLAEATKRMRGKRVPGVTIQGWIVKAGLTGPSARSKFGVPVVRVAFKSGLARPLIQ